MKKVDLKVPNKLSEITLGQYQKFSKILLKEPENDFLQKKMIEIFCGVPLSQVNFYKYSSITNIVNVLSKMFEKTPELKQVFKMNGKEFGMIPKLDDMNFGEFVDLDTYANDWEDMDKAMNVLFRPIISKYKKDYLIEDYTGELNYNMSKMPLDVALGAVFFFTQFKKRTHETYSDLFTERVEENDFSAGTQFSKRWGWYSSLYQLSGSDPTKFERIENLNISTCLTWLSFQKEKTELENKMIKDAKQRSSY